MLMVRWTTILIPLALVACAKQNTLETESATSAMRSAEAVGADQDPQASLHLQLAREGLAEAEKLNAAGDEDRAKSMLARAAADAELALLLSHEQAEKDEADAALKKVTDLRNAK